MESNIKKCWHEATFRAPDNTNPNRRQTALQSLASRYRWFSNMAMFFAAAVPLMLLNMLRMSDYLNRWEGYALMAFAVAFFMVASLMDRWLYHGILSIDLSSMTVSEVCRRAYFYRKRHLQFIAILLPMALAVIAGIAWIGFDNKAMLWGMLFGLIFGLGVGLRQLMSFLSEYKEVMKE